MKTLNEIRNFNFQKGINYVFIVNFQDLNKKEIPILDIMPIWNFEFKYDSLGNPQNWAIAVNGTIWDGSKCTIYN